MVSAEHDKNGGLQSASGVDHGSCWQDGVACAFLLAVCFVLTVPRAEIPLGDEFSYIRSALVLAQTGHFAYNGWATASVGWIVPWGALFIKLFGFSFGIMRVAMLLVGMASVVAFHQLLAGFGIGRRNASLGALTLGLSPLFLQLSASFLTDMPGLLFIVVCMVACQRAAAAATDRKAVLWLVTAVVLNLLGGTARQTTWLGALVMVPATAYLLRKRRGVVPAAAILLLVSLASVLLMMHWCNQQPYFVPAKTFPSGAQHLVTPGNLVAQTAKSLACLVFLVTPIALCLLVQARAWTPRAKLVALAGLLVILVTAFLSMGYGAVDASKSPWLVPWIPFNLVSLGMVELPMWLRIGLSVLTVAIGIAWAKLLWAYWTSAKRTGASEMERRAFWIMGPFTAFYILFLVPRGLFSVYDRYMLALIVAAIVCALMLYERQARKAGRPSGLPSFCIAAVILFALYSIASVHDYFAGARGTVAAIAELRLAGIPRTAFTADLGSDGWAQIDLTGYVNDPQIKVPAHAHRDVASWTANDDCAVWDYYVLPDLHPKYIVEHRQTGCFASSAFSPVQYRTWLPPFDRKVFIDTVR